MTWDEAVKQLPRRGGMVHSTNDVVTIRLGYDFEPHGRASETWDDVWEVRLATVPCFWKSTKGWVRGNADVAPYFKGRTEAEAKARAIVYLESAPWRKG